MVRIPPDLLKVLDRIIKDEKLEMSRPEALRYAFTEWAQSMGYLKA